MSANQLVSTEPATGAELWRGPISNVDEVVAIARENWAGWAVQPVAVRVETLRRFADVVRRNGEKLADLIARETGKPLWEARSEVESVVNKIEISVRAYGERTPQRRMEGAVGAKTALRHKPHGVVAVLGPFNFPAHLPNGHIVPALLAGNAVVFKPSEKTPATGEMLVSLFHAAGIPSGVVQTVIGGPEQGKALAAHPGIDGLFFTGSSTTGLSLSRLYADRPGKMLALEMGGNNPLVVWDAPDLHTAAVLICQSAFMSAGQRCTSARRLIVRDQTAAPLLAEVKKLADRLIVGDPHGNPAPFMGPVIDSAAADSLEERFLSLMMSGGVPIKNLARAAPGRPFISPAIIDVTNVSKRPDDEMFGPILQVIRVDSFEDAITEANATAFGLSASLIGGTPALYDRFWANVRAGAINWNRPTNGAPANAPFGGVGLSGNHRPGAFYAADHCAYPVVSSEEENPRASIGIGLRELAPSFTSQPAK